MKHVDESALSHLNKAKIISTPLWEEQKSLSNEHIRRTGV